MKLLKDILYKTGILELQGSTNIAIERVIADSRKADKFSLFVAVKGTRQDGHHYIEEVISQGAVAVVCEKLPKEIQPNVTYVMVKDSAKALGQIASNFYDNPSCKLKLIGVTGTNGKTTVATTLFDLYTKLGYTCGLISTIENKVGKEVIASTHTTPDAISFNKLLALMVAKKCSYCFMEVSSHALDQGRVEGAEFKGAIFTNISHDHLDYHQTFSNYIHAKKTLFDQLKESGFALVNADDRNSPIMIQECKGKKKTYGLKNNADFKGKIIENHISGLFLNMDGVEVSTQFTGAFNAYNLMAVYGAAVLLGQDKMNVLTTLSTLHPTAGRFQLLNSGYGVYGIIDYAHTPDALENVLQTIKNIIPVDTQLVTVLGCGGDRDKEKRPIMGKIASQHSDRVIITADNPRGEDADSIAQEMLAGVARGERFKVLTIIDRREAIRTAVSLSGELGVVLVAGKGHEKYQEVKGEKHPFDDLVELQNAFDEYRG